MLKPLPTDADNFLAFEASGNVSGEDYETVLMPTVEAALAEHEKTRLLYYLGPDFDGFDSHAMWDDAKVGMHHFTSFEKIAMVTDEKWMARLVKAFGFLMPGEVKLFNNKELDKAKEWIAE